MPRKPEKKRMFSLRMPERIRDQLEKLAERNGSDVTEEILGAVRKELKRNDLWPPPEETEK